MNQRHQLLLFIIQIIQKHCHHFPEYPSTNIMKTIPSLTMEISKSVPQVPPAPKYSRLWVSGFPRNNQKTFPKTDLNTPVPTKGDAKAVTDFPTDLHLPSYDPTTAVRVQSNVQQVPSDQGFPSTNGYFNNIPDYQQPLSFDRTAKSYY